MTYSYSINDEFFTGKYETIDEAARHGFTENPDYDEIWIADNIDVAAENYVNGERILDNVLDSAAYDCVDVGEDWLHSLYKDKAKIKELEKMVGDWLQAQEPPTFWLVENSRKIKRAYITDPNQNTK